MGKLVGCGIGAVLFKYSLWESAVIGFGMNGRGAVELVVASVPIGEDVPWGAEEIQRVDMGFMRTWDSPTKYAAGTQGTSVFGRGMVGIAAERLCADYRIHSVYQI